MKPGSLRIVSLLESSGEREVRNYEPGQEELFYSALESYIDGGYTLWLYEMTDKGWTEF